MTLGSELILNICRMSESVILDRLSWMENRTHNGLIYSVFSWMETEKKLYTSWELNVFAKKTNHKPKTFFEF